MDYIHFEDPPKNLKKKYDYFKSTMISLNLNKNNITKSVSLQYFTVPTALQASTI